MKKMAVAILAATTFVSCTNTLSLPKSKKEIIKQEFDIFNQNALVGREFIVETEEYKDKEITIGFTKDRVYGFSGVNRYFGLYKVENNKLVIENLGVTRMAGRRDEELAELVFLTALKDNKEIKLEEPYLILNSNQNYTFKFRDINHKLEPVETKNKNKK